MKKLSLCMLLIMLSEIAWALPSLTNRCGPRGIKFIPPTNATLVAFDENCDTAFIGPPSTGEVRLDQAFGSMNLLFCETVKMLPKTVEAARLSMKIWADRLVIRTKEYDEIAKIVTTRTQKLAELEPLLEKKTKILEKIQQDILVVVKSATELKRKLDDCKISAANLSECSNINQDLREVMLDLNKHRSEESNAELEVIELEYQVKKERQQLDEISDRIIRLSADLERYKSLLTGLENDALDGYQRYGQLHGATLSVNFLADWQKLIQNAKNSNPTSKLSIQQLPLVGTSVFVVSTMPEGFSIKNMSLLLGARVPGFDVNLSQGKVQKIDLGRELSFNPVPWTTNMSGQLDLNLIGACSMVDSNNQIDIPTAKNAVAALLTINLQHTYPMMMKRAYEISFNSKKVASEMEKVVETGGFLSASKIHTLTQSNMNKDTFDIKFNDEGGHVRYTDLEKQQITIDSKYEILDQILKGMNATPQFSKDKLPPPRLDRSTGARFIYENLPCFGYAICYATGFIIGVADALFGSTEAISEFKKENDTSITHRYNSTSPAYQAVTSTFSSQRL